MSKFKKIFYMEEQAFEGNATSVNAGHYHLVYIDKTGNNGKTVETIVLHGRNTAAGDEEGALNIDTPHTHYLVDGKLLASHDKQNIALIATGISGAIAKEKEGTEVVLPIPISMSHTHDFDTSCQQV